MLGFRRPSNTEESDDSFLHALKGFFRHDRVLQQTNSAEYLRTRFDLLLRHLPRLLSEDDAEFVARGVSRWDAEKFRAQRVLLYARMLRAVRLELDQRRREAIAVNAAGRSWNFDRLFGGDLRLLRVMFRFRYAAILYTLRIKRAEGVCRSAVADLRTLSPVQAS